MSILQIGGAIFGLSLMAAWLWTALRAPRHREGNPDAWWSGGDADGTGPGD